MTTHTEAEAEKKLCPLANPLDRRDYHAETRCCASECMMWRWDAQKLWRDPESGDVYSKKIRDDFERQPDRGYCGLTRGQQS